MNSFGRNMYYWRHLPDADRENVLALRKAQRRPWHSPPHDVGGGQYMITAACYEHAPIIGVSTVRLAGFETTVLEALDACEVDLHAWAILPNHYHVLVSTATIAVVLKELGRIHGCTSHAWNGEEGKRGRKVWCGAVETRVKSDRHFWASMNYIHHNPVRHGYAQQWRDWPFSSAASYLDTVGREQAAQVWRKYDIGLMGADWDR